MMSIRLEIFNLMLTDLNPPINSAGLIVCLLFVTPRNL